MGVASPLWRFESTWDIRNQDRMVHGGWARHPPASVPKHRGVHDWYVAGRAGGAGGMRVASPRQRSEATWGASLLQDTRRSQLVAQGNLNHMLPKDDWRLQLLAQGNLINMLPKDDLRLQLLAQGNLIHMLPRDD